MLLRITLHACESGNRTGFEGVGCETDGAHSLVVDEGLVEAVGAEERVGVGAAPAHSIPACFSTRTRS